MSWPDYKAAMQIKFGTLEKRINAALGDEPLFTMSARKLNNPAHKHKDCYPCPSCMCCAYQYWNDACDECTDDICSCNTQREQINERAKREYTQVWPKE